MAGSEQSEPADAETTKLRNASLGYRYRQLEQCWTSSNYVQSDYVQWMQCVGFSKMVE
jgi:hypothetical protein